MTASLYTLLLLMGAHAVCDGPLKDEFLTKGKNHRKSPYLGWCPWQFCLFEHSVIHAAAVALITRSLWLGLAELVAHGAIDYLKADGRINHKTDQVLHWICKIVWVAL